MATGTGAMSCHGRTVHRRRPRAFLILQRRRTSACTSVERQLNSRWLVERLRAAGSVPLLSTGGVDGPPSSSGLGHHPFKVAARVRIPLGVHINTTGPVVKSGVHAGLSSRRSRVQVPSGPQRHRCARAQRQRASGRVAQSAERPPEKRKVPDEGDGRVAQSAERPPEKRKVPGSTPGSTTRKGQLSGAFRSACARSAQPPSRENPARPAAPRPESASKSHRRVASRSG